MNYLSKQSIKYLKDFKIPDNFADYLIVNGIKQEDNTYKALYGNNSIKYKILKRKEDNIISTLNDV